MSSVLEIEGVFCSVAQLLPSKSLCALLAVNRSAASFAASRFLQDSWRRRCLKRWCFARIVPPADGNWLRIYRRKQAASARRRDSALAAQDAALEAARRAALREMQSEGASAGEVRSAESELLLRAAHERRKSLHLLRSYTIYRAGSSGGLGAGGGAAACADRGGRGGGARSRRHSCSPSMPAAGGGAAAAAAAAAGDGGGGAVGALADNVALVPQ